jgi:ATP-binding cassette subfamily B protein
MIVVIYGSRFMAERNTLEAQASTRMNGQLADSITNVMAIKSHGMEAYELESASGYAEKWRQRSLSTMRGFLGVSTVYATMTAAIQVVALIAAIWASEQNLISIGIVYLSISYTLTVARQLWEMNNIMRNYNRIIGDASDMVEILNLPYQLENEGDTALVASGGVIDFSSVGFKHDATDHARLFDDFDLHIPAGQKVGLVGHSGSGKSSLTRILLRFSDIDSGTIAIDGQDIKAVTQQSLRQAIAYVPQEPLLFHRSLKENISYGNPSATDEQIVDAARRAHAMEFIEKLPEGFNTLVGERGVKLSGGQRQRIAIARAILKNAPILVLDEATSALDSESEKLIQASLSELMEGRTSIVIAHRLSTIAKLDRIIVLENGSIVDDGTHSELLKHKGTYAKLWSHQTGGFIDE